jgi:molybdopterin-containing oxidoreductase family membrane subunit
VKKEVYILLARISGILLLIYVFFKAIDTLVWINSTVPSTGFSAFEFYVRQEFGTWILFTEIVLLGLLPAWMLLNQKRRQSLAWIIAAAFLTCAGVVVNRFVTTIQTLALPTLPFDQFLTYVPSWQEVATFAAVIAYGVLIYSLSFRYMKLFPQERELAAPPR